MDYNKYFDISNKDDYKTKHDKKIREPFKTHFTDKVTQFRMDRIVEPEARFLSARTISAALVDDIVSAH